MEAVCAGCGAVGTVHLVADIGSRVCTACSALDEECLLDAPVDALASAQEPWPTEAERRLRHHAYDPEQGRRVSQRRRQERYASMIHSAAVRLGYAYASERSAALFAQTSTALRRAPGAVAAAALYAVLRQDARAVDVTAVAIAMEQPYDAVARAVRTLRTQHGGPFGGVAVEDPSVYVGAHIAFLADAATELAAPNGTLLRRVQAADAQRIATAIATRCRQYELTGLDAQAMAYALALHALEGALQHTLVIRTLVPLAPRAMAARPALGCLAAPPSGSATTILARYAEIGKLLAADVAQLPWARPRKRASGRAHTAFYVRDLVALWEKNGLPPAPTPPEPWTQHFRAPPTPARGARTSPPPAPTLAQRLRLTSDAIDALSDAQVDRLLFARTELATYLRPPAEQEVVRRLKGWDAAPPAPPPVPTDTPRRLRGAAHLYTPMDPAELSEGSDWDEAL